MIRFFTRRAAAQMQQRYDYDADYLNDVADASGGAALRLGLLPLFSQYSAGVPADLWAGTAVGSTLDGDCGPCLQLVVNVALEREVSAEALRAALSGDWDSAGNVGLGMRFARAAINDSPELDALREEIAGQFGEQAVVTLSIVAATGRSWPVIKRGLGHGKVCQQVRIDEVVVKINADSEADVGHEPASPSVSAA